MATRRVKNPSRQQPIGRQDAINYAVQQVMKMREVDFSGHPGDIDYDQIQKRVSRFEQGLRFGAPLGTIQP